MDEPRTPLPALSILLSIPPVHSPSPPFLSCIICMSSPMLFHPNETLSLSPQPPFLFLNPLTFLTHSPGVSPTSCPAFSCSSCCLLSTQEAAATASNPLCPQQCPQKCSCLQCSSCPPLPFVPSSLALLPSDTPLLPPSLLPLGLGLGHGHGGADLLA